ncbi:MAG: helix-turn-helix domain-containing protein [Methylobacterium sp.]|nr:helix-turn-helix domain-containing protein [Methylobacterium sp.]MCA3600189.1 helix-turn-helix domain-containing protein [Methylobacterium sp.]MCA3606975.1 helix-turn-helix domain-containing protein [Methylobacterium sp.]MCA4923989.1 helix-turn-helix domain-containing protein [Methylobacterium sp.]
MGMINSWDSDLRRRFPTHAAALARIAELEDLQSTPQGLALRVEGFTTQETAFVNAIVKTSSRAGDCIVTSRERVYAQIWGCDSDVSEQSVSVQLSKVRRKLVPHGIAIETLWGGDLMMSLASVGRWKALVANALGGGAA